ncbi:hypothetical protein RND81_12G192200 [Saponaria officinalis]|uniref:DM2 domain-containing protein n=1 Tax=Saponaria officinalis TaxID=3572 RepID=A0AAW1HCL5_SAPOF
MASDQEIAEGLQSLFRETNPNSFTSLNDVLLHLQSKLGFDLSHKIDFIRDQIHLLFTPPPPLQPPSHPPPSPVVVSRPLPSPINPNPNPNPNVPNYHRPNVTLHSSLSSHHPHAQVTQRVFHGQSFFPMGPTEISFAQPGGAAVVTDSLSSPNSKDSSQKPKRRGGPGGLNKLCGVTPQLQAIVGQPALPRTEIVKQLWAYIRKYNLQDPSNKRKIICNEQLRLVFEVDCTDMFQMNKLLAKHILPLDATKDSGQQSKKMKVDESQVPKSEIASPAVKSKVDESQVPKSEPAYPPTVKSKVEESQARKSESASPSVKYKVKESQGPIFAPAPPIEKLMVEESQVPIFESAPPIVISNALAKFFGTSEMIMVQSDVYKRIEEYIKTEGLEDPLNSMVICDSKLQELLGCESITASAIRDTLARNHLFQQA